MALSNTNRTYGFVTKTLHWLMFLMILTVIPLGFVADHLAQDLRNPDIVSTGDDFTRAFLLFSLHKTLGLAIFMTALVRILWATTQPKPGLLNADKPFEAFAAKTVHWLLYGSLLLVPLTGWLTHAATSGFAPIWWPFGQSLPFVPKDDGLATTLAGVHMVMERVMVLSIFLHIAGALKHHFVDRDATLRRMLPGGCDSPVPPAQVQTRAPVLVALALWLAALGVGVGFGFIAPWKATASSAMAPNPAASEQADAPWQVIDGHVQFSLARLGTRIEGSFADWTANIHFTDDPDAQVLGRVDVTINVASLVLGTFSQQAMGPDYFDADFFPQASFSGEITRAETGYLATGPLTIRDTSLIIALPFNLTFDGARAQMTGAVALNRLDFGVAAQLADDTTLGWTVDVTIQLTAAP